MQSCRMQLRGAPSRHARASHGFTIACPGNVMLQPCVSNAYPPKLWQVFFDAVAQGSWLMDVKGAGHATFLQAPWLLQRVFDLLCHKGTDSHQVMLHNS